MRKIIIILLIIIFVGACKSNKEVYDQFNKIQSEIVIVAIDEKSQKDLHDFSWQRILYANFLKFFRKNRYEPRMIVFDLFFDQNKETLIDKNLIKKISHEIVLNKIIQKSKSKKDFKKKLNKLLKKYLDNDKYFVNELVKHKNIYSIIDAANIIEDDFINDFTDYQKRFSLMIKDDFKKVKLENNLGLIIIPPLREISKTMKGFGHALIFISSNKIPIITNYFNGVLIPHIALKIAMDYYQIDVRDTLIVPGKYIQFKKAKIPMKKWVKTENGFNVKIIGHKKKDLFIPINKYAEFKFKLYNKANSFKTISFVDLMKNKNRYNSSFFKNKIILIGYHNAGVRNIKDCHYTNKGYMFGVEILANIIHGLINQKF